MRTAYLRSRLEGWKRAHLGDAYSYDGYAHLVLVTISLQCLGECLIQCTEEVNVNLEAWCKGGHEGDIFFRMKEKDSLPPGECATNRTD